MSFPDLKVIIFIEFIEQEQFMGIVQNICCGQKQIQKKRSVRRLITKDLAKQLQNDTKNIYQSTNASGDSLPIKEQSEINYYSVQVEHRNQYYQKNYYEIGDFQILGQLGFGSFGKVYLVAKKEQSHQSDCEKYALKRIDRKSFTTQKHEQYTKLEKHILTNLKHPFLTNLKFSFSDSYYVYLILQWASGGSAESLLSFKHSLRKKPRANRFKELGEDGVRFIAACVVLALEELHRNGIMYRDLKPENVLLFSDGYAKLTDFGLAKVVAEDQVSKTEAGTVIYFAPQIALRMGYSKLVDFWTLGIFLYELSTSETPFRQDEIRTRVTFKQKVLASQRHRNWKDFTYGEDLKDIINKLLKYDPSSRLGAKGYDQIKAHHFFKAIDWDKLLKKELQSPLKNLLQQFPTKIMAVKKSKSVKVIEPLTHSNTYQQWQYDHNTIADKKVKEI